MHDVVVIGAGPVGLACAIEAQREGLQPRIIEKGALVNSIVGYPARMEFFSTPELIEIGGHPFPIQGYKPTREEAVEYYRSVAAQEKLDIRLYERVARREWTCRRLHHRDRQGGAPRAGTWSSSIGFFDLPNPLERPRRGSAEGDALLPGAVSVRPAESRGDRRQELGRQGGARLLSPRRRRSP